jgi:hypothetical protein
MRYRKIIFYIIIALLSCNKTSSNSYNNAEGKFVGGAGCDAWLIEQSNNITLQPMNLDSFNIIPKSGDTVIFSYYIVDEANICMDGKTIEITAIRRK